MLKRPPQPLPVVGDRVVLVETPSVPLVGSVVSVDAHAVQVHWDGHREALGLISVVDAPAVLVREDVYQQDRFAIRPTNTGRGERP